MNDDKSETYKKIKANQTFSSHELQNNNIKNTNNIENETLRESLVKNQLPEEPYENLIEKKKIEQNNFKLINKKGGKVITGPNYSAYKKESLSIIPTKIETVIIKNKEVNKGFNSKAIRFPHHDLEDHNFVNLESEEVEINVRKIRSKGSPVFIYNKKAVEDSNILPAPDRNSFIKHTFNYKLNPITSHLHPSFEINPRFEDYENHKYLPGPSDYKIIANNTNKDSLRYKGLYKDEFNLKEYNQKRKKLNNSGFGSINNFSMTASMKDTNLYNDMSYYPKINKNQFSNEIINSNVNKSFLEKINNENDLKKESIEKNKFKTERLKSVEMENHFHKNSTVKKITKIEKEPLGPGSYFKSVLSINHNLFNNRKLMGSSPYFKRNINSKEKVSFDIKDVFIKEKKINDYLIKKELEIEFNSKEKRPSVGDYNVRNFLDEDKGITFKPLTPIKEDYEKNFNYSQSNKQDTLFFNKESEILSNKNLNIRFKRENRILSNHELKINKMLKIYKKTKDTSFVFKSKSKRLYESNLDIKIGIPGPAYYN